MGHPEESNLESSGADEKAAEEFARLPTTTPAIGLDLYGFATTEEANALGEAISSWLYMLGKFLNLKRLLQVIVAYDYREKLAGLDRGTTTSKPLTATNDAIAVGIAMTPTVLREGDGTARCS